MIIKPENPQLLQTVFDVLREYKHGMFFIEFKFVGFENIQIGTIDQFTVTRNFSDGYADQIQLALTLIPEQMIQIVKAYQDLKCAITFRIAANNTGSLLSQYDPIQLEYRVLIENPFDILKQLTSNEVLKPEGYPENEQHHPIRVPLAVQLIDDTAYNLRHIELSGNLLETNAKKALSYICEVFQIKEVEMVEPDNTREYEHFTFPPMLNFSNVFSFLQERMGVYNQGIATYFSNNRLYIYPRHNEQMEPIAPGVLHIYKIATNQLLGNDGYTSYIGEDIHAVCNSPMELKDLSETNAEFMGNAAVVARSDTALDINRKIVEDGIEQDPKRTITVINPNGNTAVPGIQNAKYTTSQDNIHQLMTKLSVGDCAYAKLNILYLDLFTLYPNHPCVLHYEENKEYKTAKGIVVGETNMLRLEGRPSDYLYGFETQLILRLEPEKREYVERPQDKAT